MTSKVKGLARGAGVILVAVVAAIFVVKPVYQEIIALGTLIAVVIWAIAWFRSG